MFARLREPEKGVTKVTATKWRIRDISTISSLTYHFHLTIYISMKFSSSVDTDTDTDTDILVLTEKEIVF